MKLVSAPPYPEQVYANNFPTNLVRNQTPSGEWQIVRVRVPIAGGPAENDFELLFEGSREQCEGFLHQQIGQDFPGLVTW